MELPAQSVRPGYTEAFVAAMNKAKAKPNKGTITWNLITGEQTSVEISMEWFIPHKPDLKKVYNGLRVCINDVCDKHEYNDEHQNNCVCSDGVCIEATIGTSDKTKAYIDVIPIDYNQYVGSVRDYFSEYNHNISVKCERTADSEEMNTKQTTYGVYILIGISVAIVFVFVIVLYCKCSD